MAYTFNNIQIDHIDSSGTVIDNIATFTAATIPTSPIEGFTMGNKIRLTLTINSSGANSFLNKFVRFNPALFTINNIIQHLVDIGMMPHYKSKPQTLLVLVHAI